MKMSLERNEKNLEVARLADFGTYKGAFLNSWIFEILERKIQRMKKGIYFLKRERRCEDAKHYKLISL